MASDKELREEELLVLESLLSPEEFHKYNDTSGFIEIFVVIPEELNVIVIDSKEKMVKLNEWIILGKNEPENKTKFLEENFEGVYSRVQYLPPIRANFILPEHYPSSQAPDISLSTCWMPRKKLHDLETQAKELWNQNGNQAVLYEIFQMILDIASSGGLFPFGIPCLLIFTREDLVPTELVGTVMESKKILVVSQAINLLKSLQHFNDNRKVVIFQQGYHRCTVCFDSFPGTDFIRLTNCHHFVCKECMQALCTEMIKDASVHRLLCMECQEPLNPFDIELSVQSPTWERYQKFQLDTALSSMHDIVYCPRPWCNQAVLCEKEGNIAQCPGCSYCFCKLCKRGFHGIEPCQFDGDKKILADQYQGADPRLRQELEKKFGQVVLQNLVNETRAEEWLSGNTKPCPKCKFRVEKMSGCNKIICTKCGTPFCWICVKNLGSMTNPYDHFQNPDNKECYANLWLGENFDAESDDDDDDDPEEEIPFVGIMNPVPEAMAENFEWALQILHELA